MITQSISAIMIKASAKAEIRSWFVKKDGTAEIFLRVIISSKKKAIGLGIYWPVEKFDKATGMCIKKNNHDTVWSDYNMLIRGAL